MLLHCHATKNIKKHCKNAIIVYVDHTYRRDNAVEFLCTTFVVWVRRQPLRCVRIIADTFVHKLGMQCQFVPERTAFSDVVTCLNSNINTTLLTQVIHCYKFLTDKCVQTDSFCLMQIQVQTRNTVCLRIAIIYRVA